MSTGKVTNQAAPPHECNVFQAGRALCEGLQRWGREQDRLEVEVLGRRAGSLEAQT